MSSQFPSTGPRPFISPEIPTHGTISTGTSTDKNVSETGTSEVTDVPIDTTDNGKPNPAPELRKPQLGSLLPSGGVLQVSQTQVMSDIYDYMQVFQKIAQEMRNTARTQRNSEMQSQVTALQGAAQEMRAAAKEHFKAAMTQAITQIVSGAVQVGMAGFSMYKTAQGMRAENAGTKALDQAKGLTARPQVTQNELQAAIKARNADLSNTNNLGAASANPNTKVQLQNLQTPIKAERVPVFQKQDLGNGPLRQGEINHRISTAETQIANAQSTQRLGKVVGDSIQGTAGLISGGGGIITAIFNQNAAEHEVSKANLETETKVHENSQQQANEWMQQMMEVIRDVHDKIQSMEQANIEAARGISRNI